MTTTTVSVDVLQPDGSVVPVEILLVDPAGNRAPVSQLDAFTIDGTAASFNPAGLAQLGLHLLGLDPVLLAGAHRDVALLEVDICVSVFGDFIFCLDERASRYID